MLVLSRQKFESVILTLEDGRRITVAVVDIRDNKTRLGFDAPHGITINREEVQLRMDQEFLESGTEHTG